MMRDDVIHVGCSVSGVVVGVEDSPVGWLVSVSQEPGRSVIVRIPESLMKDVRPAVWIACVGWMNRGGDFDMEVVDAQVIKASFGSEGRGGGVPSVGTGGVGSGDDQAVGADGSSDVPGSVGSVGASSSGATEGRGKREGRGHGGEGRVDTGGHADKRSGEDASSKALFWQLEPGEGGKCWVARVVGLHESYGLNRTFMRDRKQSDGTRVARIVEPGLYEVSSGGEKEYRIVYTSRGKLSVGVTLKRMKEAKEVVSLREEGASWADIVEALSE